MCLTKLVLYKKSIELDLFKKHTYCRMDQAELDCSEIVKDIEGLKLQSVLNAKFRDFKLSTVGATVCIWYLEEI